MRWIIMVRDVKGCEYRPSYDTYHSEEEAMGFIPHYKGIYPDFSVFVTQLKGNEIVLPWLGEM